MLAPIILLPLIAAILAIVLFNSQSKAKYIAIAGSLIGLALVPLVSYGSFSIPWLALAGSTFNISIMVNPLNFLLISLVMFIGLLVMIYSAGYMDTLSEQRRYYLEMLSFQAAMATFAMSGNFITLFIAWEFLSLTSYLLIGFLNGRDSANRAARKALTIIFIGDLALLASIVIFWSIFGTLEFTPILAAVSSASSVDLTIAILLLLVAVFTKSAQFPFHEWLIDAMEGPTPVSAYLHSSTMVKAGVFVVILLYPLFSSAGVSQIILIFGVITAVLATLAASRETHVKKVIAYSTIQELSIMLVAVSSGAILAAIYFFFAQTFYKALLFFSSGAIMKATGKENLYEISGLRSSKLIFVSTLFGVISLAGFIPFSGFFANEGISDVIMSNLALYAVMSGISILTSFYIFRWFLLGTKQKKGNMMVADSYRTQPRSMVYPMALLAVLTIVSSAAFMYFAGFLNSNASLSYLSLPSMIQTGIPDSAIFLVLVFAGAILSYLVYYKGSVRASARRINGLIYTGPIVNAMYKLVSLITYHISEGINAFDLYLNDGFDALGRITVRSGYSVRHASVGDINSYAAIFIIGVLVLFGFLYYLVVL